MSQLSHEEQMLTRRALGLECSKSICRNRVAVHATGQDIEIAKRLSDKGAMFRHAAADYGSMRIFCVTPEGAKAVGKKLPPAHTVQKLN
ncbi:hypothetical protein [Bradyrhizobium sp. ERR14]|uniref:hypothetical protein n=1 Tax=Bradyrhizobium sp. ERR14 TaxID=2663837 RepID=UPI001614D7E1|nr:hypothetical protein [Bradyrhizobium sp. ERR14]MBB4398709.1 hypothetical protein [Bradyrhizobium sp. ERR14]